MTVMDQMLTAVFLLATMIHVKPVHLIAFFSCAL